MQQEQKTVGHGPIINIEETLWPQIEAIIENDISFKERFELHDFVSQRLSYFDVDEEMQKDQFVDLWLSFFNICLVIEDKVTLKIIFENIDLKKGINLPPPADRYRKLINIAERTKHQLIVQKHSY